LYVRQLLSGRDFATGHATARQMVNLVYLIGDRETGEAVVVDPAYAVGDLVELAGADGMRISGALVTHHHPDHVGGSLGPVTLEGISTLTGMGLGPVHVHRAEADFVRRTAGVTATDLVLHDSGDVVDVGAIRVELLHTPGHTPGSQCFLVGDLLVAGDTLFVDGCGRTDFPGSDPSAMFDSLQRLAALPGRTVLCPGHRYSTAFQATMDAVVESNVVYRRTREREAWLALFGGGRQP
jgi:glyoxylase-like metal-dependent hydrolase (beta-lactamase superfamily II)